MGNLLPDALRVMKVVRYALVPKRLRLGGLCLCLCLGMLWTGAAAAAGITQYDKFITADYWTANSPQGEQLVLDAAGVQALNKKIMASSRSVVDLAAYPQNISGDSVKSKLMDYQVLEDDLYRLGLAVSDNYKNILRAETNAGAVPAKVKARYALTVRKANLRHLPTGEGLFYSPEDTDFDVLQETVLYPMQPVVVLHASARGNFYYVQSENYCGWLSKLDMAFTDRSVWLRYVRPEKFLVVTAREMFIKTGAEQVRYQQGARLPYTELKGGAYRISAPVRQTTGSAGWEPVLVAKNNPAVHDGYLPYTGNNILRSAFKWHGAPYGWGGMKNSVDCSSLLYNAYRTVGVILPRNADEQEEAAGTLHDFDGLSAAGRLAKVKALRPGTPLFMEGHVVLYTGTSNDTPYVLHSLGSYYSGGSRQRVMQVVTSDLTLGRADGKSFLEDITRAVEYK